jgi:hypothetical protein
VDGDDLVMVLYEGELVLPDHVGGTRCHLRIHRGRVPIVVVTELADNPGPSVSLVFALIAGHVRSRFLDGSSEPVWVERWPQRAFASLVMREGGTASTHLRYELAGKWLRCPVTPAVAALLGLPIG